MKIQIENNSLVLRSESPTDSQLLAMVRSALEVNKSLGAHPYYGSLGSDLLELPLITGNEWRNIVTSRRDLPSQSRDFSNP